MTIGAIRPLARTKIEGGRHRVEYWKKLPASAIVRMSPVASASCRAHHRWRVASDENRAREHRMGRLEGIRVTDGEVILGPPMIFDKDNIDEVDF